MLNYFQNKSLLIFDDQVYYFDGREYSSDEAHILFMIGLKSYFHRVSFCSRLAPLARPGIYPLPPEIEICPLPYYDNVAELCLKAIPYSFRIWRILKNKVDQWDILLLSWPHPISLLLLIFLTMQRKQQTPVILVRQNLKQLVKLRYRGLQQTAALGIVNLLEWQLKLWGRKALFLAVGDEMYQELRGAYRHVQCVALPLVTQHKLAGAAAARADQSPFRLLFVGRLEAEKGLPVLIQALALLKAQQRKVQLDIVGTGVEEASLQRLVQEAGLGAEVFFHGYVPFGETLFAYYRNAELFVLPSFSEGVPNVLMEAMAFGVPIVATRAGGITTIIKHRKNGLLVTPGSAAALSEAITGLLDDPQLAADLRRQAELDSAGFTMQAQQEKIIAALAGYVESRGRWSGLPLAKEA